MVRTGEPIRIDQHCSQFITGETVFLRAVRSQSLLNRPVKFRQGFFQKFGGRSNQPSRVLQIIVDWIGLPLRPLHFRELRAQNGDDDA